MQLPAYSDQRDTFDDPALVNRFREESTNFRYQGELRLQQQLRGMGLLTLTSSAERREFTSSRRSNFTDFLGDVRLGYTHELLSEPRPEVDLKRAELNLNSTRLNLSRQKLQLESQVTSAYYNLVQSIRGLDILERRLTQTISSVESARNKLELGIIPPVEVQRLELDLLRSEADYARAESQIDQQRDQLLILLGMDLHEPLEIETEIDGDFNKLPISLRRALEVGLQNRTDLRTAEIAEELARINLRTTQQEIGPTADVNASVSMRGRGPEVGDVSNNFERSLIQANLRLNVPLIDAGDRRSRLRQAQLSLETSRINAETQRQQAIRDIRQGVRNLKDAERQVELRLAAREVAESQYEIQEKRFELGYIDTQTLLNAQTDLTNAHTDALNALISYRLALINIRLATMADLENLLDTDPTE